MDALKLAEYLQRETPRAENLHVTSLVRTLAGSSRETYSFDAEWIEDGILKTLPMILQRGASEREFNVLVAMHRAGIKTPEPRFLELDTSTLGEPFLITERVPGRTAYGASMLVEPVPLRRKLADQFIAEMVRLHQLDWRALQLEWLGAPNDLAEPARAQTQALV